MSKLWATIRKFFSKKEESGNSKSAPPRLHPYDEVDVDENRGVSVDGGLDNKTGENNEPNNVQKPPPRLHPYDEVDVDANHGVAVNGGQDNKTGPQKRATHSYDDVGPAEEGGKWIK